ncbi:MAG: hypothetical protein ACM3SY_22815 [Candidatus Omnitrophota bacterium]
MEYALEERIGNPDLFVGRNKELIFFLKWINDIKERKSKSTALLARRKMGKTALMERLYNITFYKNDGVIPFYYEVKETSIWMGDFCVDFCLTFLYQYIAFKTRKPQYLKQQAQGDFQSIKKIALEEKLDFLVQAIDGIERLYLNEHLDLLWEAVREMPKRMAERNGEFIVQIIDEFQFLNSKIYRDKQLTNLKADFAGGYLSTAESKVAPLLVSSSSVGWFFLNHTMPARFKFRYLENMPEDEAIEMIFKYSRLNLKR